MTFRWLTLIFVLGFGTIVEGEDRVSYRPEGATSVFTLVGEVLDYSGKELTIRPTEGIPQSIPVEDVVEVQTHYDPDHLAAIESFRTGHVNEAIPLLKAALKREPRRWVEREILAWLTRCSLRKNDPITALTYFREIVKSDPMTQHWGLAPIEWMPRQTASHLAQAAKPLLVETRASVRFLGASLLLFHPELGTTAKRELDSLARIPNRHISKLARAQLWRHSIAVNDVTINRLHVWQEEVNDLPIELRAGPQFLVARGYEQLGSLRLASAEYLKLTILYPENEPLVARATLEAAEALGKTGLTQEASVLYRELLTRFPQSDAARIARTQTSAVQLEPSSAVK